MIIFDTVFQSRNREIILTLIYSTVFQYRTVCTVHVHNNISTVSLYRTVYTLHNTVSQYRTVSTTVPDFINVIFHHVNVNCDPTSTATNIKLALYFNKCFFATTRLWDGSTGTTKTILFLFSQFFTKYFISLPSSDNNNVSDTGVTTVVLENFTKYNNNGNNATTTTTHHSLVKPILGLGGVPKLVYQRYFQVYQPHFGVQFLWV